MYFGNGSYYDALREIYGEDEAFKRYEKKWGRLLVATANESGATRLFVRSVNPMTDLRKKNGWWNTFTITNRPCEAGTYICKIDEVRSDKNGYPIFVVHTVVPVDEKIICCNELMYLFGLSRMFIEEHIDWNGGYNMAFFEEQIEKIGNVEERDDVNRHVSVVMESVRLFINGKITRDQIVAWLNEPTEWQKADEAFKDEVLRFFDKDLSTMVALADVNGLAEPGDVPLTAGKCLKFKADRDFIWPDQKVEFVKDLLVKYECAVCAGHIEAVEGKTIWDQIECYLKFDKARKEANKAAKAAAKKAKKAAAKAIKQ